MSKQIITQPATLEVYTRLGICEAVRAGSSIFVSGQVGWDHNMEPAKTFEGQVRLSFQNMAATLVKAGSSFDDVTELRMFLVAQPDMTLMEMVDVAFAVKCELFPGHVCSATAVGVAALVMPELMLECAATACID